MAKGKELSVEAPCPDDLRNRSLRDDDPRAGGNLEPRRLGDHFELIIGVHAEVYRHVHPPARLGLGHESADRA